MKNQDWTKFKRRININSSIEDIFNSWTTQEKLEEWFLSKADFNSDNGNSKKRSSEIKKDDSYNWMWYGSDNIAEGRILENNNIDFLRFTFLGCEVSVKIKTEKGENLIELTQYNIPTDEESTMSYFVGCTRGWTFYLTNLKSILEGGIDLRNKNNDLIDVINT
jgi:uncharacterized protein YndB with AHSA1/START domain